MKVTSCIALIMSLACISKPAVAADYPYNLSEESPDEQSAKHCYSLYHFLTRLDDPFGGPMENGKQKLWNLYSDKRQARIGASDSEGSILTVQHERKIATGLVDGSVQLGDINGSLYACTAKWKTELPDNVSSRIRAALQKRREDDAEWAAIAESAEAKAIAARRAAHVAREEAEASQQSSSTAGPRVNGDYAALNGYMNSCMGMRSEVSPVHPKYAEWRALTWKCEEGRADGVRTARQNGDGAVSVEFSQLRFPWE